MLGDRFRAILPFVCVFIAGLFLRAAGIYFDYPGVNVIWDEHYHISYILKMSEAFDPAFDGLLYPLLLTFIYAPVVALKIGYTALTNGLWSIDTVKLHYILSGMGELIIVTRWFSVAFGAASIIVVYRLFRLMFGAYGAHAAAAAYSFSVVPVFLAHWGKVHSAMGFFYLLALYFILKFEREKSMRYFYFSILSASLAFSVHYVGVSAFILPALGAIFNREIVRWKGFFKAALMYLVPILIFYGLNFYGIRNMIMTQLSDYYGVTNFTSLYPVGRWERFYFVFRDSWLIEPVLFSLFAALVFFRCHAFIKDRMRRYVIYALIFNYFIMLTLVSAPRYSRWLMVLLSLAVPFGIAFVFDFFERARIKWAIIIAIALLLLGPGIATSIKWLSLLRVNTFIETKEWLAENLHGDEVVYSFEHRFDAPLSYEAARFHKEVNGQNASAKINYIVEHKEAFEGTGINLFYDFYRWRYQELGGPNTKYILIAYWKKERGDAIRKETEKYHRLRLARSFSPTDDPALRERGIDDYLNNPTQWTVLWKLDKSGPFVDLYEVL